MIVTSTGRLGSRRVRAAVIGTVGAVVLAGALVAFSEPAPSVAVVDDWGPGDGLTRYTVTLAPGSGATTGAGTTADGGAADGGVADGGAAEPVGAAEPAGGPTVGGGTADRGTSLSRGTIDIGLLAAAQGELGAGGEVVVAGGLPYYVVGDAVRLVGSAPGGEVVPAPVPDAPAPVPTQASASDGGGDSQAALAALAARPGIVSAQPIDATTALVATRLTADELAAFPEVADVVVSPQVDVLADAPDDPYLAQYGWNLHNTGANAYQQAAVAGADVDAPTAWPATQGQGAVVAIVDTGFDSDHPDLAGSLWTNPTEACGAADTNGNGKAGDCHGWNFYANSADVDNGSLGSHGTSVAGVIGARLDNGQGSAGVAPAVSLMPLVVGGGSQVDVNLAALAIRYAADNGADVVNASFGGSFAGPALTALSSAIDYAISKGVVVVAAAGNDSADRDAAPMYPASLPNPALITVASSTATDELAAHSAYGATSVDIAAPGTLIFTTYNDGGYRLVSGTSVAAPHVTAAAALHMSVADRTPAEVRTALLDDAERLPALAGRMVSGGRLNVGPLGAFGADTVYTFSGMVAAPGEQSPSVEVTSDAAGGSYDVVLGLAMLVDGEIWAVSGEDVNLGQTTATTGDDGTVRFPLGTLAAFGTQTLAPHLTLGEGKLRSDRPGAARRRAAHPAVRRAAPGADGSGSRCWWWDRSWCWWWDRSWFVRWVRPGQWRWDGPRLVRRRDRPWCWCWWWCWWWDRSWCWWWDRPGQWRWDGPRLVRRVRAGWRRDPARIRQRGRPGCWWCRPRHGWWDRPRHGWWDRPRHSRWDGPRDRRRLRSWCRRRVGSRYPDARRRARREAVRPRRSVRRDRDQPRPRRRGRRNPGGRARRRARARLERPGGRVRRRARRRRHRQSAGVHHAAAAARHLRRHDLRVGTLERPGGCAGLRCGGLWWV